MRTFGLPCRVPCKAPRQAKAESKRERRKARATRSRHQAKPAAMILCAPATLRVRSVRTQDPRSTMTRCRPSSAVRASLVASDVSRVNNAGVRGAKPPCNNGTGSGACGLAMTEPAWNSHRIPSLPLAQCAGSANRGGWSRCGCRASLQVKRATAAWLLPPLL